MFCGSLWRNDLQPPSSARLAMSATSAPRASMRGPAACGAGAEGFKAADTGKCKAREYSVCCPDARSPRGANPRSEPRPAIGPGPGLAVPRLLAHPPEDLDRGRPGEIGRAHV